MRNHYAKTLITAGVAAALALPAGAQARHGADDPAGHVRHASHQRDDRGHAARRDDSRHHHRAGHHRRHRADDGPGHS